MNDTAKTTAKDAVADRQAATIEALQNDLAEMRAHLAELTDTLKIVLEESKSELSADLGQRARAFKARAEAVRGEARHKLEAVQEKAVSELDDIAAYARQSPVKAMGMAAGLGLVIGLLLLRR